MASFVLAANYGELGVRDKWTLSIAPQSDATASLKNTGSSLRCAKLDPFRSSETTESQLNLYYFIGAPDRNPGF